MAATQLEPNENNNCTSNPYQIRIRKNNSKDIAIQAIHARAAERPPPVPGYVDVFWVLGRHGMGPPHSGRRESFRRGHPHPRNTRRQDPADTACPSTPNANPAPNHPLRRNTESPQETKPKPTRNTSMQDCRMPIVMTLIAY